MTLIQLRRGLASQWTSINPILALGEPGVETDTGQEKIGDGVHHWSALAYVGSGQGGGSVAGGLVTHKFPFAFNTPSLLTGATAVFTDGYTPAVGDILHDAWFEIDTPPWDGTTPLGDLGTFDAVAGGVWSNWVGQAIPMDHDDHIQSVLSCVQYGTTLNDLATGSTIAMPTSSQDGLYSVAGADVNLVATVTNGGNRFLPAIFANINPLKVCVSQDGTNTGADPGSTQGAAILYIVTSTPA